MFIKPPAKEARKSDCLTVSVRFLQKSTLVVNSMFQLLAVGKGGILQALEMFCRPLKLTFFFSLIRSLTRATWLLTCSSAVMYKESVCNDVNSLPFLPPFPWAGNHTVEERRRGEEEHVSSGCHRLPEVWRLSCFRERAGAGCKGGERVEPWPPPPISSFKTHLRLCWSFGGTCQLYKNVVKQLPDS